MRARAGDRRAAQQLARIRARRRRQGVERVDFAEGDTITAGSFASGGGGAAGAVEGGVTDGQEERAERESGAEEGGTLGTDAIGKAGEDMAEDYEVSGAGAKVGAVARLALVPHLVNLLREHKFKEALGYLKDSVGAAEKVELIKLVAEKLKGELSHHALELFERAALVGVVYDVLKLGWEWTYGGIKAVQEAHERGDLDSRIGIYAWAWADAVLQGQHNNPGAITTEQREAMHKGIEDGLATRELSPEMPELLLAEYGSYGNARRALEDALYKRAGIGGVRTHAGR
jgi:hypothetical protein